LWAGLGGDAARAFEAVRALAESPEQSVPVLARALRPAVVERADAQEVARLVRDLDSDDFEVRETAERRLRGLGAAVGPALREALVNPPSLEVRRRLERLVESLDSRRLSGPEVQAHRALYVLELAGTPAARKVLERLAGGAPGERLTEAARATLARLRRP
jgi:hypothetical protein